MLPLRPSSLFPLKLSSIISPDKLPITISLPPPLTSALLCRDPCFHWQDPSHAEIHELFSVFRAPDFSDWYFSCCCYKAWTLSPGDGSLVFKLYEVKWCSNTWTGLMFRFNLYLFKFPVVCCVNWKKPKSLTVFNFQIIIIGISSCHANQLMQNVSLHLRAILEMSKVRPWILEYLLFVKNTSLKLLSAENPCAFSVLQCCCLSLLCVFSLAILCSSALSFSFSATWNCW